MLQINTFWKLTKITITKPYEQMCCKTFYITSPIFVEDLEVKRSLGEFLQILLKYFGASN